MHSWTLLVTYTRAEGATVVAALGCGCVVQHPAPDRRNGRAAAAFTASGIFRSEPNTASAKIRSLRSPTPRAIGVVTGLAPARMVSPSLHQALGQERRHRRVRSCSDTSTWVGRERVLCSRTSPWVSTDRRFSPSTRKPANGQDTGPNRRRPPPAGRRRRGRPQRPRRRHPPPCPPRPVGAGRASAVS